MRISFRAKITIMFVILFSISTMSFAATEATLTWSPNEEPDLAGYKVKFGNAPDNYNPVLSGEEEYSLNGGVTWQKVTASPPNLPAIWPITIPCGPGDGLCAQVKFQKLDNTKIYYFAITAFDGPKVSIDSVVSGEGEEVVVVTDDPAPVITTLQINGLIDAQNVWTNDSNRQVRLGIVASDNITVNSYLLLDGMDPNYLTKSQNLGSQAFTAFPAGPLQTQNTVASPFLSTPLYNLDGNRSIYIWVKDNQGAISASPKIKGNVFLDRQAPSAAISTPANGDLLQAAPASITGTAQDPAAASGLQSVEIQVTDGAKYLQANDTWTTTAAWFAPDGGTLASWTHNVSGVSFDLDKTYTIWARAKDNAGNVSSVAAADFTFDSDNDKLSDALDPDDDDDGMSDVWENAYGFDPLDDSDADGDFDNDLISNLDEYLDDTDPTDSSLAVQAILSSPAVNATNVTLSPTLQTLAYGGSVTHTKTQWQISEASSLADGDFSDIVFDVTSPVHLVSITVPVFVLEPGKIYSWRARFYDVDNGGVQWSATRWFTTTATTDISPVTGIPYGQEVLDGTVDLNGDSILDTFSSTYKAVICMEKNGQIGVEVPAGLSIDSLKAISRADIFDDIGKPETTYMGLIRMKISGVAAGATVNVTIYLSEAPPVGTRWYKYNEVSGWVDYSANAAINGSVVTLTLVDGGLGDADGSANGIIVDPSGAGVGASSAPKAPSIASGGGGGGGGGCFIAAAANGSTLDMTAVMGLIGFVGFIGFVGLSNRRKVKG